ncbi:MAG: C39 family peptidase [bacterium]|nr:C39 family peptidase [bacterium]
MKLAIPHRRQLNDYMCGPATLQMVLAFLGEQKTQRKIRKLMKASPRELKSHGMDNYKMVRGIQRAGFYAYVNEDSNINELKSFINQGYPVVVNYIEPSNDDGHFAVVKGYNSLLRTIVLNDPWNGDDFILSEKQFLIRWHAKWWRHDNSYKGHWLMVAAKTAINTGRLYTPYKYAVKDKKHDHQ